MDTHLNNMALRTNMRVQNNESKVIHFKKTMKASKEKQSIIIPFTNNHDQSSSHFVTCELNQARVIS